MKSNRYAAKPATSKAAIARTEAYYRMMADGSKEERAPPPMGFGALRKAAAGKPVDQEAEAERAALRQGDLP